MNPTSTGKTTTRYYYHTNQLGSIIAISTSTGLVVQKYSYNAYGKPYVSIGNALYALSSYTGTLYGNTRLYTGREFENDTGYYYNRARYYSSDLGRFISRDPVGQNDQVNLYTYVANSPLKYVDRMGREKVLIIVGLEKREGEFDDIAEFYRQKYRTMSIKDKNIIIKRKISTTSEFNEITDTYKNNIHSAIWITHSSEEDIGKGGTINFSNISKINLINTKPMCTNKGNITIVGCNAGGGDNPIAAELSNQTGVPVTAATHYVLPTVAPNQNDRLDVKAVGYIGYWIMRKLGNNDGEPTIPLGDWKQFTPNN